MADDNEQRDDRRDPREPRERPAEQRERPAEQRDRQGQLEPDHDVDLDDVVDIVEAHHQRLAGQHRRGRGQRRPRGGRGRRARGGGRARRIMEFRVREDMDVEQDGVPARRQRLQRERRVPRRFLEGGQEREAHENQGAAQEQEEPLEVLVGEPRRVRIPAAARRRREEEQDDVLQINYDGDDEDMEEHREPQQQANDNNEEPQQQANDNNAALFLRLLETMGSKNKNKKYNEVPKYNGDTDYSIYQVQFNTMAEANEWTTQDKRTALLQALTGNATDVIANLQSAEVPLTFEALDEALVKTFSKTASMWERKKDFTTLMQEKDQTIRQFARQVERLGRAYLRNMKESDIQESLIERFIKGLADKKAAGRLAYTALPTLDEALKTLNRGLSLEIEEPPAKRIRLAKAEDTDKEEEKEEDAKVSMVYPDQAAAGTSSATQTGGRGSRGGFRGGRGTRGGFRGGRGSRGGRGGYNSSDNDKHITCRFCGKIGHRMANCWHNTAHNGNHNNSNGNANNSNGMNCHSCGKPGHFARNCRNNKGNAAAGGFSMPNVPPDLYKATVQWFLNQNKGNNGASTSTDKNVPFVPSKNQEN
ncbi:uncharacterized protein LOC127751293 [Frankliniella occidentalis]|uniref:Uncharacterized protein LOC127751293 n=1 Tax=Frankliniella occidentalis TaxID=133901 RepID=A0A9C6X7F4_FRAOC|nr:uncharacterized protein LOC127751293 [Frankliniella occidentalis]